MTSLQDVIPAKITRTEFVGSSASDGIKLPTAAAAPLARSWSEAEAFDFCSKLTQSHYENFPVGSILIPKSIQPAIHSLYAFMRTADDFADENRSFGDEAERLSYLKTWERMLAECERGEARHPIFIALSKTLQQYKLPVQWLRDLLHAFTLDVTVRRYETYADVLDYCRYSANPVGRLILTLFGYRDEALYQLSDRICTGLQLANHWQDVAVDLNKDRIYLPLEDLKRFGLSEKDVQSRQPTEAFCRLMSHEVAQARTLFSEGEPLPRRVSGRLRLELRMTWLGGVRVLEKIEKVGFDVFNHRPTVTRLDWLRLGLKALRG